MIIENRISELKKLGERPCFAKICEETRQALASYHAGEALKDYLRPMSPKEAPDKYKWRQDITVEGYDNYPKEVCQHYTEGVFRTKQPFRETKNEPFDLYLKEEYARWFKEKCIPNSVLLPELFIGYAKPYVEGLVTVADEKENKVEPYPIIVFPHHVINFEIDQHGELLWICVGKKDGEQAFFDEKNKYTIKGESVEMQPHGFSRIPFDRFTYFENYSLTEQAKTPVGRSLLFDVVQKSLSGLNYLSMLKEAMHFHLMLKLIMPEGTFEEMQKHGVGNDAVIRENLPPEGGPGTRYLETPSMEITTLERIVYERTPKSVYRSARLRYTEEANSESGVAKLVDLMPETAVLKDLAAYWQMIDLKIVTMLAENQSISVTNVKVEYPTSFNTQTTQQYVSEIKEIFAAERDGNTVSSKTGKALMMQETYGMKLPDVTDKQWAQIEKELTPEEDAEASKPNELKTTVGGAQAWKETVIAFRKGELEQSDLIAIGVDLYEFKEEDLKKKYPVVEKEEPEEETVNNFNQNGNGPTQRTMYLANNGTSNQPTDKEPPGDPG